MIPLVDFAEELRAMRELVERTAAQVAEELATTPVPFTVGTMIELPRACLIADRLARDATFFSFGTNDLTQTALGFSRDDAEGRFLTEYLQRRIVDRSPFETIDARASASCWRRRSRGGAGADPSSVWASAASMVGIRTASPSSTRQGSTTSAVRRFGSRSPASRRPRPRSLRHSLGADEAQQLIERIRDPASEHIQVGDGGAVAVESEGDLAVVADSGDADRMAGEDRNQRHDPSHRGAPARRGSIGGPGTLVIVRLKRRGVNASRATTLWMSGGARPATSIRVSVPIAWSPRFSSSAADHGLAVATQRVGLGERQVDEQGGDPVAEGKLLARPAGRLTGTIARTVLDVGALAAALEEAPQAAGAWPPGRRR